MARVVQFNFKLLMLLQCAPNALEAVLQAMETIDPKDVEGRTGVRLTVHNDVVTTGEQLQTLRPELDATISKLTFDQALRFSEYVEEKDGRLRAHPEHIGSTQSANEELGQFGGSIRLDKWRIGCSGLPKSYQDDAVVLVAAVLAEIITEAQALSIGSELNCHILERALAIARGLPAV